MAHRAQVLSLETVFPGLKLTQNCCINMSIALLKNWQFHCKLAPSLLQYETKGESKISIFQLFIELGEI